MAQSGLPENVFYAAIIGDTLTIKEWLAQGGDPNQGLEQAFHEDDASWESGSTLLIAAASMGRLDIMHLLLVDHNADVNVTAGWTALIDRCSLAVGRVTGRRLPKPSRGSSTRRRPRACRIRASGRSSSTRGLGIGADPRKD